MTLHVRTWKRSTWEPPTCMAVKEDKVGVPPLPCLPHGHGGRKRQAGPCLIIPACPSSRASVRRLHRQGRAAGLPARHAPGAPLLWARGVRRLAKRDRRGESKGGGVRNAVQFLMQIHCCGFLHSYLPLPTTLCPALAPLLACALPSAPACRRPSPIPQTPSTRPSA